MGRDAPSVAWGTISFYYSFAPKCFSMPEEVNRSLIRTQLPERIPVHKVIWRPACGPFTRALANFLQWGGPRATLFSCDLINRARAGQSLQSTVLRGGREESSSFIEECYLPVTVMAHPAGVKKKNPAKLQLLQQIPSQQPTQNKHIYLSFIHNFWCETAEAPKETGRSMRYQASSWGTYSIASFNGLSIQMLWRESLLGYDRRKKKKIPGYTSQNLHRKSPKLKLWTFKLWDEFKTEVTQEQISRRAAYHHCPSSQRELWKVQVLSYKG